MLRLLALAFDDILFTVNGNLFAITFGNRGFDTLLIFAPSACFTATTTLAHVVDHFIIVSSWWFTLWMEVVVPRALTPASSMRAESWTIVKRLGKLILYHMQGFVGQLSSHIKNNMLPHILRHSGVDVVAVVNWQALNVVVDYTWIVGIVFRLFANSFRHFCTVLTAWSLL